MMNTGSKQDTVRNNLIRIVTVILLVLLLYKVVGLPFFLSLIIAYVVGLAVMLVVASFTKQKAVQKNRQQADG